MKTTRVARQIMALQEALAKTLPEKAAFHGGRSNPNKYSFARRNNIQPQNKVHAGIAGLNSAINNSSPIIETNKVINDGYSVMSFSQDVLPKKFHHNSLVNPDLSVALEAKSTLAKTVSEIFTDPDIAEELREYYTKNSLPKANIDEIIKILQNFSIKSDVIKFDGNIEEEAVQKLRNLLEKSQETGIALKYHYSCAGGGVFLIKPKIAQNLLQLEDEEFIAQIAQNLGFDKDNFLQNLQNGQISWQELMANDQEGSLQIAINKEYEIGKSKLILFAATNQECNDQGVHLGNVVYGNEEEIRDWLKGAGIEEYQINNFIFAVEFLLHKMLQNCGYKEGMNMANIVESLPIFSIDAILGENFKILELNARASFVAISAWAMGNFMPEKMLQPFCAMGPEKTVKVPQILNDKLLDGEIAAAIKKTIAKTLENYPDDFAHFNNLRATILEKDGRQEINLGFVFILPNYREKLSDQRDEFFAKAITNIQKTLTQIAQEQKPSPNTSLMAEGVRQLDALGNTNSNNK